MGTKSKPFRAFVEGNTISDGREITASMIDDVVATFSSENYQPRINIEHINGYSPEPPFNGYGTVTAVEAKDDDFTIDGKTQKRRALYCVVDANEQLVKLVKADQKPFPSVELTPSYAGTNRIGLIGLAFTDKPASIGTQALQFSRTAPGTLFATSPDAVDISFDEPLLEQAGLFATVKATVAATMAGLGFKPSDATPPAVVTPPAPVTPPVPANDNALYSAIGNIVSDGIAAATAPIIAQLNTLKTDYAALTGKLAKTEAPGFSRAPASGGTGELETDC